MQGFYELKELLAENPMLTIGVLLFVGYLISKLAIKMRLPSITGYILAGLLMNHSTTGVFPQDLHYSFKIITEIALGLVALTIGAEFSVSKLRLIGRDILTITVIQVIIVFALVTGMLTVFGLALPFALLLGVIATASEPATTVAEVHALRARGRFVDYLFTIVALDDAACIVIFSLIFAFVSRMLIDDPINNPMAYNQILHALKEIFLSLILGLIAGFTLYRTTKFMHLHNEILIVTLGIIFITTALAVSINLSPLLTNLAAGSILINISTRNHRILRTLEPLTPPVYALFFVLAGTKIDYRIIMQPGIILWGTVYILFRALGKYSGIYLGCRISGVEEPIRSNLGWSMLSQGAVALGLILLIQTSPVMDRIKNPAMNNMISNIFNIVLLCVFISELIGPPLSKLGIIRGCQIVDADH